MHTFLVFWIPYPGLSWLSNYFCNCVDRYLLSWTHTDCQLCRPSLQSQRPAFFSDVFQYFFEVIQHAQRPEWGQCDKEAFTLIYHNVLLPLSSLEKRYRSSNMHRPIFLSEQKNQFRRDNQQHDHQRYHKSVQTSKPLQHSKVSHGSVAEEQLPVYQNCQIFLSPLCLYYFFSAHIGRMVWILFVFKTIISVLFRGSETHGHRPNDDGARHAVQWYSWPGTHKPAQRLYCYECCNTISIDS